MASTSSAVDRAPAARRLTPSTMATNANPKIRRSSAYDANFEQHLIDHNIYPPFYDFPDDRRLPKPANWAEIRQALKSLGGSLSPSLNPELSFEDFERKIRAKTEATIMRTVVPSLTGNPGIPNEGGLPFTNLDSLTANLTVDPVPDFFDGARSGDLDRQVREELDRVIIPSRKAGVPIAPNLFLEAKGPKGALDVAERQAVLDGAHGARMMHALQNYLVNEPVYDGNAYTFTATFVSGGLKLYAHHMTAPAKPGERPEYHITQLRGLDLTDDPEIWREGTQAFRNLRLFAKDCRDRFIRDANARLREANAASGTTEDGVARTAQEHQAGDSRMLAEPEDDDQETHQEANVGLTTLDQPYGEGVTDYAEGTTDVTTSFASPSASSGRQDPLPFKHPPKVSRTPPSPSCTRAKKR